jgi:hypothetical protein
MKDYEKFIIGKYIPGINKLGIHIVAGWTVLIGGYSDIVMEGVSNDLDGLEQAMTNKKYMKLHDELLDHVKGYKTKVLTSTGQKDDYSRDVQKNTVKFIQMWDVIPKKKEDYRSFVTGIFYPCMEELGIQIATEWEVLIGEGPRILCEGRAFDIDSTTLISNLQKKKYQKSKHSLKQYVENYQSRILVFHVQKVLGYKTVNYELVTF